MCGRGRGDQQAEPPRHARLPACCVKPHMHASRQLALPGQHQPPTHVWRHILPSVGRQHTHVNNSPSPSTPTTTPHLLHRVACDEVLELGAYKRRALAGLHVQELCVGARVPVGMRVLSAALAGSLLRKATASLRGRQAGRQAPLPPAHATPLPPPPPVAKRTHNFVGGTVHLNGHAVLEVVGGGGGGTHLQRTALPCHQPLQGRGAGRGGVGGGEAAPTAPPRPAPNRRRAFVLGATHELPVLPSRQPTCLGGPLERQDRPRRSEAPASV